MGFFDETKGFSQSLNVGAATRQGHKATYWGFVSRVAKAEYMKTLPGETVQAVTERLLGETYERDANRISQFAAEHVDEFEVVSVVERHEVLDIETEDILIMWRVPIWPKTPTAVH